MLATFLALLAMSPVMPAPAPPDTVVSYRIDGPAAFGAVVRETLADPHGWALGGAVRFREVRSGGRFVVRLAEPATVASFASCSEWYSCRSGEHVLINAMRWRDGAASYADLAAYRRHVINHEVGHALGFGHSVCGRGGADAAVMQQQSKGLGGCRARSRPLPAERRRLAALLGVRARSPDPTPRFGFWTP